MDVSILFFSFFTQLKPRMDEQALKHVIKGLDNLQRSHWENRCFHLTRRDTAVFKQHCVFFRDTGNEHLLSRPIVMNLLYRCFDTFA